MGVCFHEDVRGVIVFFYSFRSRNLDTTIPTAHKCPYILGESLKILQHLSFSPSDPSQLAV